MNATERRIAILATLCKRRFEKMNNLAFEFGVSKRTIEYDVSALSLSYPIYTSSGNGGGVYVVEGFYLGKTFLTNEQEKLLERLIPLLNKEDKKLLQEIIDTFARPKTVRLSG